MINIKKILAVSLLVYLPTYIMGNCQGGLNGQKMTISCQGQGSKQLRLTSKETEIYNSLMNTLDVTLDNSDNIGQAVDAIKKLLRLGNRSIAVTNSVKVKMDDLDRNINFIQTKLQRASTGREQLEKNLSSLINQRFNEQQYFVRELTSLKQQYITDTNRLLNNNRRLNSIIKYSVDSVAPSLSSKFNDYVECLSKSEVLKRLILPNIGNQYKRDTDSKSSFSSFSSGSNYISDYSSFVSTLSGLSISKNSLYSCAEDFEEFNKQFRRYDVTLGLVVNGGSVTSINNLYMTYTGENPSSSEVQNFIGYFRSIPKNSLQELSDRIDSYMMSH